MMSVRLKRDVSRAAARSLARFFKRERLRVLQAFIKIEAFANNLALSVNNHAADQRTRTHLPQPARRQFKRAPHHALIKTCSFKSQVQSPKFQVPHPKSKDPNFFTWDFGLGTWDFFIQTGC